MNAVRPGLPETGAGVPEGVLPAVFSVAGGVLSAEERDFFREVQPLGFILFARNCESPDQLRRLTGDLREALGRGCPVMTDQEGGRVQRLRSPFWRAYPPMRHFGETAETDPEKALADLRFTVLQMAEELLAAGIDANCAPVLDVPADGAHDVIGDRAFSRDPQIAARLGISVCRNLLAAGVRPVIKHLPGHGRAGCDSHKDLPRVCAPLSALDEIDFEAFRIVCESDIGPAIWGMAAHVIFEAVDPDHPSSVSPKVIGEIIRGRIGFRGLLLSDDLDMQALARYGGPAARARAVLDAGCDAALYCAGDLAVMQDIAGVVA